MRGTRSVTSTCRRLRSKASERSVQTVAEVEAHGPLARLRALPGGDDPRDAVDAFLAAAPREQVPDAGLEDEAERVEAAGDDVAPLAVADVHALAPPQRARDHRQVGRAILLAEPAARVDVEEL